MKVSGEGKVSSKGGSRAGPTLKRRLDFHVKSNRSTNGHKKTVSNYGLFYRFVLSEPLFWTLLCVANTVSHKVFI